MSFFKKFSEIDNMTPALIQEVRDHGYDKEKWAVCVKTDGCNVQVALHADGTIHYGSRNQELGRYDNFNGYQHTMAQYKIEEKVRALKAALDEYWLLDIKRLGEYSLVVFGELLGGVYRHRDVAPVKGSVKIQGRVNYCPDNRWVVFDIFWYQERTNGGDGDYLAPEVVNEYCDKVGLYHQQIKAILPFDEAIAYPNDYEDTTGHDLFGLPQITPNIVEGNVLKPIRPLRFRNGERVIMKNKNRIFLERGVKTNKVKNPPEPMTELDKEWYNTYMTFVTESRMMSVLSKMDITTITGKDFGKLLSAFIDDADAEFNQEYGGQIKVLEEHHNTDEFNMHKVTKAAKSEASKMIRPHFLDFLRQNGVNC